MITTVTIRLNEKMLAKASCLWWDSRNLTSYSVYPPRALTFSVYFTNSFDLNLAKSNKTWFLNPFTSAGVLSRYLFLQPEPSTDLWVSYNCRIVLNREDIRKKTQETSFQCDSEKTLFHIQTTGVWCELSGREYRKYSLFLKSVTVIVC